MGAKQSSFTWQSLAELPQPRHLYAHASGTRHYHLGCFEHAGDSLAGAMDWMVLRGAAWLQPRSRILDLGCGIGGSCELLQKLGHDCLGIDPCLQCIRFARAWHGPTCRFAHGRAEDLHDECRESFDAVLLIEVGQHHADLRAMFDGVAALLRPGGLVLVADVATRVPVDFAAVPFHRRGWRRQAARGSRLATLEEQDLSAAVLPTLGRLQRALNRLDSRELSDGTGRPVADELRELTAQCSLLEAGFRTRALAYEYLLLQKPAP